MAAIFLLIPNSQVMALQTCSHCGTSLANVVLVLTNSKKFRQFSGRIV